MPRIARSTSPVDSDAFVPPKRSAASSETTLSPLSSPRSPSPPSSPVSSIQPLPRRQPVPAMWPKDMWKRQHAFTQPTRYAPIAPRLNPVSVFATPSSSVARTPQATRPLSRFWIPGQQLWVIAPLDEPLMSPGEYRVWEETWTHEACQTYEMYVAHWRRHAREVIEREDAAEGITYDTTEFDIFMAAIAKAREAQALHEIVPPTSPKGETETPGAERRSRVIKGGLYSLARDTNLKKRILSDDSDVEKNEGRAKRRSVGSEEEIDADGEADEEIDADGEPDEDIDADGEPDDDIDAEGEPDDTDV